MGLTYRSPCNRMRELFLVTLLVISSLGEQDLTSFEKRQPFSGMRGRRADEDEVKRATFNGMRGKKASFAGMRGKKATFNGMRGKKNNDLMDYSDFENSQQIVNSLHNLNKRIAREKNVSEDAAKWRALESKYLSKALKDVQDIWGKLFNYRKRRLNQSGFVGLRG